MFINNCLLCCRTFCTARSHQNGKISVDFLENHRGCPGMFLGCSKYVEKRSGMLAWKKGVDWFNDLNGSYRGAIGAVTVEFENPIPEGVPCVCSFPIGDFWEWEFTVEDCSDPTVTPPIICQAVGYSLVVTDKKSDGVVLTESQIEMPFATHEPVLLENSSHMQVRNNEALRDALTKLYDGDFRNFFKTLEKPE